MILLKNYYGKHHSHAPIHHQEIYRSRLCNALPLSFALGYFLAFIALQEI
jgi:hypothetical protein